MARDPRKISAGNIMPGDYHGFLTKQSEHLKAWRKMFFILSGHQLYWFKTPDAKEAKGMIQLEANSIIEEAAIKGKNYAFAIITGKDSSVILASSQEELEGWTTTIRSAIVKKRKSDDAANDEFQILINMLSSFDINDPTQLVLAPRPPTPQPGSVYLTLRQEGRLKKVLIELLLDDEIIFFRENPTLDKFKSVNYLRLMYQFFFVRCPIFASQPPVFYSSLNNLMNNLPKLSKIEQRGEKSKRDRLFRKIQKVGVMFFYAAVRTANEVSMNKAIDLGYTTPDAPKLAERKTQETAKSPAEQRRKEFLQSESKAFFSTLFGLTSELTTPAGLQAFLSALKSNKTIETLPEQYKKVFQKAKEFFSLMIEGGLQDEARYARLKKIHDQIPYNTLPAILAIANPIKLLGGLLGVALVKPLGAKNLMQRVVKIATYNPVKIEIGKLEKLIQVPGVVAKIQNFVNEMFANPMLMSAIAMDSSQPRENINAILAHPAVQPVLNTQTLDALTDDDIVNSFLLVQNLVKLHDCQTVINALGDDHLISLIKELFPVLQAPLMELFAQGNISQLISQMLRFFSQIMRIAEAKKKAQSQGAVSSTPTPTSSGWFSQFRSQPIPPAREESHPELHLDEPIEIKPEEIGKAYLKAVSEFVDHFYAFLHRLAANDKGLLQELLRWVLEIFDAVKNGTWSVDIHDLYLRLSPEQQTQLVAEIDAYDLYRASKYEKKNRKFTNILDSEVVVEKIRAPKLVIIPTLKQPFHHLLIEGLKREYATKTGGAPAFNAVHQNPPIKIHF